MKESTVVHVTERGFEFTVAGDLLGLFACRLDVAAGSLTEGVGFEVTGVFQKEATDDICGGALTLLGSVAKEASTVIQNAQGRPAQAKKDLERATQDAYALVGQAQAAVSRVTGRIAWIDRRVKELSDTYLHELANAVEIARLDAEWATLETVDLPAANFDLAMAEAVYAFATVGTAIVGYVLTPALQAIKDAVDQANRDIESCTQNLARVRQQLGRKAQLVDHEGALLSIERIEFREALHIVKSGSVGLKLWITFLGIPTPRESPHQMSCQLASPAAVAKALVTSLVGA